MTSQRSRKRKSRSKSRAKKANSQAPIAPADKKQEQVDKIHRYTAVLEEAYQSRDLNRIQFLLQEEEKNRQVNPLYKLSWWTSLLNQAYQGNKAMAMYKSQQADPRHYALSLPPRQQLVLFGYTEKVYGGGVHNYWLRKDLQEVRERLKFGARAYWIYYQRYFPYYLQMKDALRYLIAKQALHYYLLPRATVVQKQMIEMLVRGAVPLEEEWTYRLLLRYLPLFTFRFWGLVLDRYSQELNRIIERAPVIDHATTAYRGEDARYYKDAEQFVNVAFVSTSESLAIAEAKRNPETNCCVLTMHLEPGVRAVYLHEISALPEEEEILLGLGHEFEVMNQSAQGLVCRVRSIEV
jgi:hypothetical protein